MKARLREAWFGSTAQVLGSFATAWMWWHYGAGTAIPFWSWVFRLSAVWIAVLGLSIWFKAFRAWDAKRRERNQEAYR
jgi:hypothetical protein